jgi:hypothetical protein
MAPFAGPEYIWRVRKGGSHQTTLWCALAALAAACDVAPGAAQAPSVSSALTSTAESLEYQPAATRRELYVELARQSQAEEGSAGASLFPFLTDAGYRAAPGLKASADLVAGTDAAAGATLRFEDDGFSTEPRDALGGLSERAAAELVARALLRQWGVVGGKAVPVVRAARAGYAAAWVDGELRLNPSFIYLAATPATGN